MFVSPFWSFEPESVKALKMTIAVKSACNTAYRVSAYARKANDFYPTRSDLAISFALGLAERAQERHSSEGSRRSARNDRGLFSIHLSQKRGPGPRFPARSLGFAYSHLSIERHPHPMHWVSPALRR
jgi:hypothetical protein